MYKPSVYPPKFSSFSLIELIVVMMVVSILATVVIVKFTDVDSSQSNRIAANELRSHLTYIRNMAMNRERTTRVVFNIDLNNYTVWIDTTGTGSFAAAKDPVTQKDWVVNITDKFRGAKLDTVDIDDGTNLYFSETNGIPCTAGGELKTNGTIVFKSGLTVTVVRCTGYIDLD